MKLSVTFWLLFISFSLSAKTLTLAIVDTGLCSNALASGVITHSKMNRECSRPVKFERSRHAHFIIENFLKNYRKPKNENLILHHFNVFNQQGEQDKALWLEALSELQKLKPDMIIMAVGFKGDFSTFPTSLPGITILAAGTEGFGITQQTVLWPQLLKDPQILMVGHFFPSRLGHLARRQAQKKGQLGPDLLNKLNTSYFVAEAYKKENLGGSSRACALASAFILNKCKKEVLSKNIKDIFSCLQQKNSSFLSPDFGPQIELLP